MGTKAKGYWRLLFLLALLAMRAEGAPPTHLVLVGGGVYPPQALAQFAEWAGGKQAKVLIVSWATQDPDAALRRISAGLAPFSVASITQAPSFEEMPAKETEFRKMLSEASGIFFTGGNQNRIMKVVEDAHLQAEIKARFFSGVVFGGSSAGTAVMSETMFTGTGDTTQIHEGSVGMAPGLGLVHGTLLDTHFLKRRRENRLLSVLLKSRESVGLGIDEGTAITLTDNRDAQVVGPGKVMKVTRGSGPAEFAVSLESPGDTFQVW